MSDQGVSLPFGQGQASPTDPTASFMCLSHLPSNEQDLDAMTEQAAARFRQKYGQAPEKIWIEKRNLWLGPIPQERMNQWHTVTR